MCDSTAQPVDQPALSCLLCSSLTHSTREALSSVLFSAMRWVSVVRWREGSVVRGGVCSEGEGL